MAHKCGCAKREPKRRNGASVGVQRKPSWPAPGSPAIGVQSKTNPGHRIGVPKKTRTTRCCCSKDYCKSAGEHYGCTITTCTGKDCTTTKYPPGSCNYL